jgi:tetratricopeptide (TPR) repeat protein
VRLRLTAPLAALALCGCVYFNTFYNAQKYYKEGEKIALRAPHNEGLPASARTAFERSAEKSSQVLTAHPKSKYADDALLLLGKAHFWLGNYPEAAAALGELIDSHPESGLRREAAVWLVRAGAQGGDVGTAQRVSGELLAEGDLSASDRVALQLERAHLALDAGDPAAAVSIYEEVERTDPDLARREHVPLRRAQARLAQGDTTAALADLSPLVASDDDPELQRDASVVMAGILASSGESGQAIETYRAVLAGNVGDSLAAEIHLALAETQQASGDVQAAAEELSSVARLVPSTPVAATALYRRGLIQWHDLGARDDAKKTLLEAYLEAPDSPAADSAAAAARTIQEIQHYEGILAGSERVLSPLPPAEVKATATYLLAELLYTRERDEAAAHKLFSDMLTLYPGSAWTPKVLYTLGWLAEHGVEARAEPAVAGNSAAAAGPSSAAAMERAAAFYDRVIAEYPRTEYARYASEALADAAGSAPTAVAGGEAAGPDTAAPAELATTEGAAPDPAGGLLPLPDQSQVVEIPPSAPGAPSDSSPSLVSPAVAEAAVPRPDVGVATVARAPAIGAAGTDVSAEGDGEAAAENTPAPSQPDSGPSEAAAQAQLPGRGVAEPAQASATGPEEAVDQTLMAYTLALPRAQDPLLGIEDRLLARRRADLTDQAPNRRPEGGAATPGLGGPAAAADSLTPGQIDSLARSGDLPAGADSPPANQPTNPAGPAGNTEHPN